MAQVPLTNWGGLVSSMDPTSLPEGASPRTFDVDFVTGGWRQRPGLQNVYSYQGQSQGPNPAFHAVDTAAAGVAWINPGNILLNDGNAATVTLPGTISRTLNISTVSAGSSGGGHPLNAFVTFTTAPPSLTAAYTFSGLTGYTALNGQTLTPTAISGNTGTFVLGTSPFPLVYPLTPDTGHATVPVSVTVSDYLDVTDFTFAIGGAQTITGVAVALKGFTSAAQTVGVQLLAGGVALDPPKTYALATGAASTVTLGGSTDQWGAALSAGLVNESVFGVRIQANGSGSASFDYVTVTIYTTSSLVNFNYVQTLHAPTGIDYKLALDAAGNWWIENVTDTPDVLSLALAGTTAGSYGSAVTVYNRAFVANATLTGQVTGSDIPRQYNFEGNWWDRITQVGPASAPVISAAQSSGSVASITSVSIAANIATITAINTYVAGEVGTFAGLTGAGVTGLNGQTLIVLSSGLSGTQFEVAFNNGGAAVGPVAQVGATFTPQYTYPIATITQPAQASDPSDPGHVQALLWSAGPGSSSAGNTVTVYYSDSFTHATPDSVLVNAFNSGVPLFVYISGQPFGNGVWQVTSVGNAIPPGASYYRWYFTYQVATANYQFFGGPDSAQGFYQITQGTLTLSSPVPGLSAGSQVSIAGASVPSWDGVFTIESALNSGAFNITQSALSGGIATYTWTLVSGAAPAAGQLVTVTNTLNANGILNVAEGVIASASGVSSGTFTVSGFAANLTYASTVEQGQATTAGTQFIIDPGAAVIGSTTVNPIYGNSTGGTLTVVGQAGAGTLPIGAGTRQGVWIFITRNGLFTAPGPPSTFTVAQGSNYLQVTQAPIGPPNVIGRLFACTEAGQNGIPGANFYTTTVPTVFQVGGVQYTSNSFLVPDNTTTTAKFTFSDAVLLQGDAIDIPGNNLFNLIEIGNPAAILQYADRTFYIDCQNKVQNFNNLSFDGGYQAPTGGSAALPGGWFVDPASNSPFGPALTVTAFSITSNVVTIVAANTLTAGLNALVNGLSVGTYLNGVQLNVLSASGAQFTASFTHADVALTVDSGTARTISQPISLRPSPVFGNSLYVTNQTGVTLDTLGLVTQSAYRDAWNTPILNPNGVPTNYSVRVTCRCPSGAASGNLVLDLTDSNSSTYGTTFGSFVISLPSMTTQFQVFTGPILLTSALSVIPPGLLLRAWGMSMPPLADFEIDRIEIFPTDQPVLTNTVLVSYPFQPEQVDGSTGLLILNSRNQEPVYGATIIRDQLCFKKSGSLIEVENAANYEPDKWSSREVSARGSGACGPYAFAQGDEWDIGLSKTGFYVYSGGQPMPISHELQGFPGGANLWDTINWKAAQTFWMANDLRARRFYAGVAMSTPNFWLPNAPANASPTTPNVILMCNYEGCPTAQELEAGAPVHVTMFGSVKALDMRRKWSIWQIASPYGGVVLDGLTGYDAPFICNGIQSSKIYRLRDCTLQNTDDGAAITPLYTTYRMPDGEKAQALGIGSGQKYCVKWMAQITGSLVANQLQIRHYQNQITDPAPVLAAFVPSISPTQQNNIEWRAEVRGQGFFVEYSVSQGAGWLAMSDMMAEIVTHPWGSWRGVSS